MPSIVSPNFDIEQASRKLPIATGRYWPTPGHLRHSPHPPVAAKKKPAPKTISAKKSMPKKGCVEAWHAGAS
jgi:hypothetical protein